MAEQGEQLSEREMDVLNLLAQGSSNKEIAQTLFISPNTVKVHLRRVYTKLGVNSRTEATVAALEQGLLSLSGQTEEEQEKEKAGAADPSETETESTPDVPLTETAAPEKTEQEAAVSESSPQANTLAIEEVTAPPQTVTETVGASGQPKENTNQLGIGPQGLNRWLIAAIVALLAVVVGLLVWPEETVAPTPAPTIPVTAVPIVADIQIGDTPWYETQALPEPVTQASMIAAGPVLYLFGGITADGTVSNQVLAFTNSDKTWSSQGGNKPTAIASAATAELGGELYLLGGITDSGGTPSAKVEVYSPSQNLWRATTDLPEPLTGGIALSSGGRIYYFGGYDGSEAVDTVYQFNGSDDWELVTTMPEPTAFASGGLIDQKVYITGSDNKGSCHIYDLETAVWENCLDLPEPRAKSSGAVIQNKLYVLDSSSDNNLIQIYNPATNSWELVEKPLTLNDGAAVANIETQLFFFGGEQNGELVSEGYKYAPLVYQWFIPAVSVESSDE